MKHIAIVTPCILPVPATEGGAVEELITRIISDNELNDEITLDVFSVLDESYSEEELVRTNVISIEYKKGLRFADRVLDKIHRTIRDCESYRLFDKNIVNAFKERLTALDEPYYAVIVENQVSIAKGIVSLCRGNYEFPIFFHMHNDVDIYRSPKGIRELASYGVQFIAVSEYIKKQILKCANDAVVHVLYNGTELGEISPEPVQKDSDKISFLYAGRIIPEKGVYELVQAFDELLSMADSRLRDSLRLDIIGFSYNQTAYENMVQNLAGKHSDKISCKRRIATAEMNQRYSQYDIVVMPTMNEEPFGLVALETMSKGLPLITTDSGALPEVVGDGAHIVERGENFSAKLAKAMLKLATDKNYREELGRKAFARSREVADFDIKNYYTNFAEIIDAESGNDKISVIVPVYNVSDYLVRCVDSLLKQTYSNLEILLIDDGSTDASGKLCDELAERDSRIKVIHQINQGLSGARNTGLDNATGEYVFFCDSDDFIDEATLDYMYNKLRRDQADVVACGFSQVWDDYAESGREELFTSANPGVYSGHKAVIQMMTKNNICTVAWNKLYKRSLFDDVRFPVGALHEDEATVYKLLYGAKIVSYTPEPFYKYYQRDAGIMGGGLSLRGEHLVTALKDRMSFFEGKGDTELAEYSRVALLERIKFVYRNVTDEQDKMKLADLYKENLKFDSANSVVGAKKRLALLLWKYIKY